MGFRSGINLRAALVALITAVACAAVPAAAAAAPDGALDPTFGSGGFATSTYGTWAAAAADVVQPNGDVVTAGETDVNGTYELIATRYTASGQPDPGFGADGIVLVNIGGQAGVDSGYGLALQPDGKIVIAGAGVAQDRLDFAVVRLNTDGSLDSSFGNGGIVTLPIGYAAYANAVLVDPEGNIDLGGIVEDDNAVNHFAFARLTPNGARDETFGTDGVTVLPPNAAAWAMGLEPDGSLVLAGQELDGGTQKFMVARVLANGIPAASFGQEGIVTIPIGSSAVGYAIAIQSDGRILIGGNATGSSGSPLGAIARLNLNGSLDPTFGTGGILQFAGGGLNDMTLDASGRIYLAGVGASVIRLNPDGSTDTSFGSGGFGIYCDGINCAANGVALDPSTGKPVLAGIATVDGKPDVVAIRLLSSSQGGTSDGSSSDAPNTGGTRVATTAAANIHQLGWLMLHSHRLVVRHGKVTLRLRCASAVPCNGTVTLRSGGIGCIAARRISIGAGRSATIEAPVRRVCLTAGGTHTRARLVLHLRGAKPDPSQLVMLVRR
jgi:uncharacterized delta-60 repeat protein